MLLTVEAAMSVELSSARRPMCGVLGLLSTYIRNPPAWSIRILPAPELEVKYCNTCDGPRGFRMEVGEWGYDDNNVNNIW